MRELSLVELEQVGGGNPLLVGVVVVGAVAVVGGIGLLAYAVHERCSGSLEVSDEGIKIEVTCPGPA
ncbi:MAG: hypothetical protein KA187_00215 [Arenimonas sp.]|nr:hypothetical protein [Arenimonas sp.]MBP6625818.1 hypothetical protein [Arenimonas sp.]